MSEVSTIYVPQRHRDDCGVAALAMFMGVKYERALARIQKSLADHDVTKAMGITALLAVLSDWDEFPVATHLRDTAKPALLCVASPLDPMVGHAVYWDGKRVWDPAPGREVDEQYALAHTYLQIVRARDLVGIMPSRSGAAIVQALDPHGEFLAPGDRMAA